jgi:hypothetical protein
MDTKLKQQIDRFLDEFIKIEYKDRDHAVAREHYRNVFYELIPKYFSTPDTMKGE